MLFLLYKKLVTMRMLSLVVSGVLCFTQHCLCDRVLCLKTCLYDAEVWPVRVMLVTSTGFSFHSLTLPG